MAKKITKTKAKKHTVTASRIAAILIMALITVACFGTGCDWLPEELFPSTHEHIYSGWDITDATCGKDGVKTRYCIVCGEEESEVLPATGNHVYGGWTTAEEATCGEDGEKEHSCTVCGRKESEVLPATGNHSYGGWSTVTEPVCGEEGEKVRTCSVCGNEESEVIPAPSEHDYTEWVIDKEATCVEDGKKTRSCDICGHKDIEIIPATGVHNYNPTTGICTDCGYDPNVPEPVKASDVEIHFLELGNKYTGDCTLIKCGNTEVLIDAGSRTGSAATIKNYVDQFCTDGVLEYVIATHGHQDHIAGFVGNSSGSTKTGILYQYRVGTLIQFAGTNATTDIYKNYCTAVDYAKSQGTTVFTAKQCWYQTDGANKQYYLDEAETVSINILYQKYYDQKTSDENDYSVCMLLKQEDADKTYNYLFTGDLEASGESSLVDSNELPEVELFKGGHHGSYTASTDKLLKVIKPKNVAVCCCCGTTEYTTNVANTFPAQAFIDRVAKYTANVYCTTLIIDYSKGQYTSMNGNIVFYTEDGELKLRCSNNTTILKETDWFKANRTWNGV